MYKFESEFVDINEQVLHITCKTENNRFYDMLINTWDDPYVVYYSGVKPDNEEVLVFKEWMFDYLIDKYPDHFLSA